MTGCTEIDVIIVSCARNLHLQNITNLCVNSLLASEDSSNVKFNIIVVESQKKISALGYVGTTTIYPDQNFGYNKYLNRGIDITSAKYVCLCNNDLFFHRFWATEILKSFERNIDLSSASPICSFHHPSMGFDPYSGIYNGYRSRFEMAGWCIFLKRDIFRIIGRLDENLKFWCIDNDISNTLASLKLRHSLVSSSIVDHLDGQTIMSTGFCKKQYFTNDDFFYYEKKWNSRLAFTK